MSITAWSAFATRAQISLFFADHLLNWSAFYSPCSTLVHGGRNSSTTANSDPNSSLTASSRARASVVNRQHSSWFHGPESSGDSQLSAVSYQPHMRAIAARVEDESGKASGSTGYPKAR